MAIIKCPQCGKEVSNRTQKCPRCNTILIEEEEKEKVSAKNIKTTIKENIINASLSMIFIFATLVVCQIIAQAIASVFLGQFAVEAIQLAHRLTYFCKFLVLMLSALFFSVLPLLFRQKPDIGYISGIIITIILCIICLYEHENTVGTMLLELGRPDLYSNSTLYGKCNGVIGPLLQGALSIMGYGNPTKKFIISSVKTLAVFFIFVGAGSFLLISVFAMGITGISLAQILGSVLVFAWSVVKSNEMKRLLNRR